MWEQRFSSKASYGVASPVTAEDVRRMREALESGEAVGFFTRRIINAEMMQEA